jgi:hypothetical protein
MATIPSIAMIPSGYKASKVYSVLPTDGAGDLTFSRASLATRVNSDGLIEEVLSNVPRLDYSDGGCPSLLIEPQSTNLLLRSEEFDDVYWVKNNATVTANAAVSPDGNTNADKLVEDTANSTHRINPTAFSFLANTNYTFSFFAKAGERTSIVLREGARQGIEYATINLINGDVTLTGVINTLNWNLIDVKAVLINGFYRISVTANSTLALTSSFFMNIHLYNGTTTSYLGDGTSGIYIWGAQLEALPYATSYIPTVASTVTRVAETVSKTGLSDYINSSEGVLFAEISPLSNTLTNRSICLNSINTNNAVRLQYLNSSLGINAVVVFGGSNIAVLSYNFPNLDAYLSFNKIAVKYKENDFALWVNGVEVATDSSGSTFPSNTLISLASNYNSLNPFFGKVKNLQVYTTALTDAQLIALTTL